MLFLWNSKCQVPQRFLSQARPQAMFINCIDFHKSKEKVQQYASQTCFFSSKNWFQAMDECLLVCSLCGGESQYHNAFRCAAISICNRYKQGPILKLYVHSNNMLLMNHRLKSSSLFLRPQQNWLPVIVDSRFTAVHRANLISLSNTYQLTRSKG